MRNLLEPTLRLTNPITGGLYLTRWQLFTPYGWFTRWVCQVQLHVMSGPDPDRHMHNHPWFAVCFVLRGGYLQKVMSPRWGNRRRGVRVRFVNVLRLGDYHKIVSVLPGTVTVCVCGPAFRSWGFMVNGENVHWRKYLGLENGQKSDDPTAIRTLESEEE